MIPPVQKRLSHRIYLNSSNRAWLSEDMPGLFKKRPSKNTVGLSTAINQALRHFRATLLEDIKVADWRFNVEEMDVMNAEFRADHVPWYFANFNHFNQVLQQIDESKVEPCKHWQKAVSILRQHSTLSEINAIVFRSKY